MLLSEINFADEDDALAIAQRAARSTHAALADYLMLTAQGLIYRPWAAAHDFIAADPERAIQLTSPDGGLTYANLPGVLKALKAAQAKADGELGLVPEPSQRIYSGAVPTVIRF